jgi:hypothetical protein
MANLKKFINFLFPYDKENNAIQVAPWGEASNLGVSAEAHTDAIEGDHLLLLVAETDCWVSIGAEAIATATTSTRMKDGMSSYQPVYDGQRISVIGGTLNITEVEVI